MSLVQQLPQANSFASELDQHCRLRPKQLFVHLQGLGTPITTRANGRVRSLGFLASVLLKLGPPFPCLLLGTHLGLGSNSFGETPDCVMTELGIAPEYPVGVHNLGDDSIKLRSACVGCHLLEPYRSRLQIEFSVNDMMVCPCKGSRDLNKAIGLDGVDLFNCPLVEKPLFLLDETALTVDEPRRACVRQHRLDLSHIECPHLGYTQPPRGLLDHVPAPGTLFNLVPNLEDVTVSV